jgi:hypothetical protein
VEGCAWEVPHFEVRARTRVARACEAGHSPDRPACRPAWRALKTPLSRPPPALKSHVPLLSLRLWA